MPRPVPTTPSLSLHTDRQLVPAGVEAVRFAVARLVAPEARRGWVRPPVSIGFAIDRSSSMRGAKLAQAKRAVIEALRRLDVRDRFTVVAFDAKAQVLASGVRATRGEIDAATAAIAALEPGHGTDLAAGWLTAARRVEETVLFGDRRDGPAQASEAPSVVEELLAAPKGECQAPGELVGRCLLLTDGLPSRGIASSHLLARNAVTLRSRGVSTSAFGLGLGFDEALLTRVADAGGGSFRYLDGEGGIAPAVHDELGDALQVACRSVRLLVAASGGAKVGVLGPYPTTVHDRVLEITLPDLVAQQVLELVLHVEVPPKLEHDRTAFSVHVVGGTCAQKVFRHVSAEALRAQRGDRDVVELVASRFAAMARERAALLKRAGNVVSACEELVDVARRVRSYIGPHASLVELAALLEMDAEDMRHGLDEGRRKTMFAHAASAVRSRRPDGGSWRP